MKKNRRLLFLGFLMTAIFCSATAVGAKTIFVDNTLGSTCNGNYSIANRTCTGSNGNAYTTVQAAINAMSVGDHVVLRGGTYYPASNSFGCIIIPQSLNGTSWTEGSYNKISSCSTADGCATNEWAILDGSNGCGTRGVLIGYYEADNSASYDIKYWWFERLEITHAKAAGGADFAYGMFIQGGPVKLRYLYVHDNVAPSGLNNPAGVGIYHLTDSTIEYSYFLNNGTVSHDSSKNSAHVLTFDDYHGDYWMQYGYTPSSTYVGSKRNIVRYNLFDHSTIGYKHKGYQAFSGRNPSGGHPDDDTYKTWGDDVHHNIFKNISYAAIFSQQDFIQVHNNIVDTCGIGIVGAYEPEYSPTYKETTYNNTLQNVSDFASTGQGSGGIIRMTNRHYSWEDTTLYGYDYNNILDTVSSSPGYCTYAPILVGGTSSCVSGGAYTMGQYVNSNNYFYRPVTATHIQVLGTNYSATTYQSQTVTHDPRVAYSNVYNSGNLLYVGTTGADKYRIRGAHVITGTVTAANGGIGIPHPYLTNVRLPSYVGAVNPNDDAWVAGVLKLTVLQTLIDGGSSDPAWIEGNVGRKTPSATTITVNPVTP